MNNKQKRIYINKLLLSLSVPYIREMSKLYDYLELTPKQLFKYRSFDKYTWEMLEEPYAFLSPVKNLDDPFDCLNEPGIEDFYDIKSNRLSNKGVSFLIDYFIKGNEVGGVTKAEIKRIALESMDDRGVDPERFANLASFVAQGSSEFQSFLVVLDTINENINGLMENTRINGFAESALFSSEKVGVCSLSELRDNKVMWSLYGKTYSGYCVEYEIPRTKEIVSKLCPVIYTKRANNNFTEKFLRYAFSALLRGASDGQFGGDEIGASMELFCTKDTDWSYQREWRIIGQPARHTVLPVKAVYLGFKVADSNKKRMIRLAKKKGFELYVMNPPDGSKRISYKRIL